MLANCLMYRFLTTTDAQRLMAPRCRASWSSRRTYSCPFNSFLDEIGARWILFAARTKPFPSNWILSSVEAETPWWKTRPSFHHYLLNYALHGYPCRDMVSASNTSHWGHWPSQLWNPESMQCFVAGAVINTGFFKQSPMTPNSAID